MGTAVGCVMMMINLSKVHVSCVLGSSRGGRSGLAGS